MERAWIAPMTTNEARQLIEQSNERMRAESGEIVFDEWALILLSKSGAKLEAYIGPRVEQFRLRFKADIRPLQMELDGRELAVGDFGFAADAEGTAYDACARVGRSAYLWCNHTHATMTEIRESGAWLPAQKIFADMCEQFRVDPLVSDES